MQIFERYIVSNVLELNNDKELISFFDDYYYRDGNRPLNIYVPISAAVTAYSRIHMYQFKLMQDVNLYYTDTDSIDIIIFFLCLFICYFLVFIFWFLWRLLEKSIYI